MRSGFYFISISFALSAITLIIVPMFIPMSNGAIKTVFDAARCDACHSEIQEEFSRSKVHKTLECSSCHHISEFGPDLSSHYAITADCIDCHADLENEFNNEAHIDGKKTRMCSGCHTHVRLKIEKRVYNGTDNTISYINGSWEINSSLSGENRYTEDAPPGEFG